MGRWNDASTIEAAAKHRPAAVRALSSRPAALVLIGRGPAPKRTPRPTQAEEVIRMATAAAEILRTVGLEGHPDLVMCLGAQMFVEIEAERKIVADAVTGLARTQRYLDAKAIELVGSDILNADRNEDGTFAWSFEDA